MLYKESYSIMPGTPLQYGMGISTQLGPMIKRYGYQNVLVVTDNDLLVTGVIDKVLQSLNEAGIGYDIFSDVVPNPPVSIVRKVVDHLSTNQYNAVIGIGGGSAMDTAKAGRLFSAVPNALTMCNLSSGGQYIPRTSKLGLVTVPTLSGSGCEYMVGAVITDDATHSKVTLAAGDLMPDLAVVDPLLQLNVPTKLTVAASVDAMCHAFNKVCAPGCEFRYRNVMALDAIKAIWENLPVIVNRKPDDEEARCALCYGAIMSGYVGGGPNGNINHPIAHTVSRFFESVPHGVACGWALPITLRHMLPLSSGFTQNTVAEILGVPKESENLVEDIVSAAINWLKNVGISSPSNWETPISYEAWMDIVPYVKEDDTWNINPNYAYPQDDVLAAYMHEAYYDLI